MTGLIILAFAAGFGGLMFNDRLVKFEQSRREVDPRLVQTQLIIGSLLLFFMGLFLLGFRLSLLGS
jgi:hypothetical protein